MSPAVSYDEALKLAVRIEENGARFYSEAARVVTDPDAAQAFRALAAMELAHKGYFSGLAGTQAARESRIPQEGSRDHAAYLNEIADGALFDVKNDPASLITPGVKPWDVIRAAITLEKDSVVFYLGLRDSMADKTQAEKIEGIIREEMSHISTLSGMLKKFKY